MNDDAPLRRASDTKIQTRMTAAERDLYHLGLRLDAHLGTSERRSEQLAQMIKEIDDRTDRITNRMTALMAGIAVVWTLAQLLLPLIQNFLRIPT